MAPAGDATAPAADATAPAADATAPPPARVTADAGSSDVGPAPWIVAGIGGALAVAGGVLMGVGAADAASVTGAAPGTRWADLEGAAGRANGEWGAGLVLLGVGVAALGAGVVWGAVGGGGGESASARVGFGPGSVSVSGTF
jgi:hypothetical protein